jgi:GT2 family glycosyltransferase
MIISIVVLNYNGSKYLRKLLDSIIESNVDYSCEKEIIVIDNASTDNSFEILKEYEKKSKVTIVLNKSNVGYGRAMNLGFKLAKGEYVAFLNNDLYCHRDWLLHLIKAFKCCPKVAVLQPLILDYDASKIQSQGLYCDIFGSFKNNEFNSNVILAPFGAAFIVKREFFKKIGGFDPDYFMYGEEIDLGLRTWMSGGIVLLVTESKVFHKGGGSTPGNSYRKYLYYYNSIKNRLTTLIKTFSGSYLIVAILGTIFIIIVRIFRAGFSKDLLVIR